LIQQTHERLSVCIWGDLLVMQVFPSRANLKPDQHSLRAYLRRSNYTLSKAIVHSRAQFDDTKWIYLTRTCQKLTDLTINGSGIIGDTLSSALPFASSLTSIVVSANRDISYATVVGILNHCQKTLVHAAFLSVKNSVLGLALPQLDSLRTLDIRSSTEPMLVSQCVRQRYNTIT
jgi:F-box/TPR repeat protein Pof3